jgi:hypothetical protein
MQLKRLDVSYNNLTEVSNPLPQTITQLNLNHQNFEWTEWGDYPSDYLLEIGIEQLIGNLPTVLAYISEEQQIGLPTIFTYNHQARDYSLRPTLQVSNFSDLEDDRLKPFGHLAHDGEHYAYAHTSTADYQNEQDAPVIISCDRGCYRADLRFLAGDANMSGATDVLDVQRTLNYALITERARRQAPGDQYSDFNHTAANTFEDDVINVQDIVCTVNIVLSGEDDWGDQQIDWGVRPGQPDAEASDARRIAQSACAAFVADGGSIVMQSSADVAAIALELRGVKTDEVRLMLPSNQWQLSGRDVVGGSRYVIFSPTGQTLPTGTTTLLQLSGEGEPVAAQCADAGARQVPTLVGSEATGVQYTAKVSQSAGRSYDLQGRRIDNAQRKGVYIVDGQKKVVK